MTVGIEDIGVAPVDRLDGAVQRVGGSVTEGKMIVEKEHFGRLIDVVSGSE